MKVVQESRGLSSITIAADTYTSVLPQLARRSAEDVAALIRPPARPRQRQAGAGQWAHCGSRGESRFRSPARPRYERDDQQPVPKP